jgi:hypothetical protein
MPAWTGCRSEHACQWAALGAKAATIDDDECSSWDARLLATTIRVAASASRSAVYTVCTIATNYDAGQGAHQQYAQEVPVDRAGRPMSDPGHQRQRHRVRDVGCSKRQR